MEYLLTWLLDLSIGEKKGEARWIVAVSWVVVGLAVLGIVGTAGYIPIALEPLRTQLGAFGELFIHWPVLIVPVAIWMIVLIGLRIYFRLVEASVGKPD